MASLQVLSSPTPGASSMPGTSLQGPSVGVQARGPATNVTPPTNTISSGQIAPKDLSSTYANVGGTIYNKQSGTKFSNPADFFKDSGQSSFNNLKFDTAYAPSGNESVYGQPQTLKLGDNQSYTQQPGQPAKLANEPTPSSPAPTTPTTPPPPTYSPTDSGLYGKLIAALANSSQTQGSAYTDAKKTADDVLAKEQGLTSDYSKQNAQILSRPEGLTQQTGQQGVLAGQYQQSLAGLQSQYAGASSQLNAANTQQGLLQTLLQAATTGASPQLAGYNQQAFNPTTGTFSGSGNSGAAVSQMVAKLQAGTISPQDALSQLSVYGQPAVDALNKQLGTDYNFNTAEGSSTAQQQNAVTGGTAAVQAGNNLYQGLNQQYQTLATQTIPNITNFGNLLTNAAGGINPFDWAGANKTWGDLKKQLGDPGWNQFQSTFQQLQKNIATMAASGGAQTPTANTAQSQLTLDPNQPISTIKAVLDRVAQEGQIYLNSLGTESNNALLQAQGGGGGIKMPTSDTNGGNWGWNGQ